MAAPRPIRSQSYEQVYELVRTAILNKQPIAAVYRERRRLFCPYVLGRNREGRINALCYQFGGGSASGLKEFGSTDNWRCVEVEKLTSVELLSTGWINPPNYSRHQSCIETIEAEVERHETAGI